MVPVRDRGKSLGKGLCDKGGLLLEFRTIHLKFGMLLVNGVMYFNDWGLSLIDDIK